MVCALEHLREVKGDWLLELIGEYIFKYYSIFCRVRKECKGLIWLKLEDQTLRLSRLPAMLLGTKVTLGFFARYWAMLTAASNFFISIWVAP